MDPVTTIDKLTAYGPLGVVCAVELFAIIRLYVAKEAAAKEHKEEIRTLTERHIAKAENWVEHGHQLADNMERLVSVLEPRLKRRDRG
jgi:hypothetical protein